MRVAALFLLVSAGLCAQSADEEFSTGHWVALCEPSLDAKLVAAGKAPNDFLSGKCWGAFQAMQVLAGAMVNGKPALGICSGQTSTRTWITIFYQYAKSHPALLDEPFAKVAQLALSEAFPCNEK